MADKVSCGLGIFAAYVKRMGATIDEAAMSNELKDPHAKSVYAKADLRYQEALLSGVPLPKGLAGAALGLMEKFGIHARGLYSYIAHPDAILGNGITDAVEKIYQQHIADPKRSVETWKAQAVPQLKALYKQAQQNIEPLKQDYLSKYMDEHIKGGSIYGSSTTTSHIGRLAKNLIGNFINWNPALVAYHALEAVPKLLAYSIEHAGAAGPGHLLGALADHFAATNGTFFGRAADLDKLGIYGLKNDGPSLLGMHRLVDLSEHPLRGIAYRLGERLGTGGTHAVEKTAFVYRFGNEPALALGSQGFNDLGLMRYSIGQGKFYLNLAQQFKNPNAMMALAAFSAMNAIQTGGKSVIPLPVQAVLPDDFKQAMSDFDEKTGLNWVQRAFGTDLSAKASPLSFPSFGVPLAMASDTVKTGGSSFHKAAQAFYNGNPTEGAAKITQGLWGLGTLGKIPGVNVATYKAVAAVADQLAGDNDNALLDFAKKSHLYVEPQQ